MAIQQREHLTLPIIAFSFSTGINHIGKPLWTHLNGGANSFFTFETLTEQNVTDGGINKRPIIKIIYDGKVHEQINLDHLVRLSQIDEKSGTTGNEKSAKLHVVIKKPMMAMKYTTEDFDIRRFQVKFLPPPDTGFDTVCERFRVYGLKMKDHGPVSDTQQHSQSATGHSMTVSSDIQSSQITQTAHSQLPTHHRSEVTPLPVASSQTQGQRVNAYNIPSQSETQPQSIPLHDYEYQSQRRYPSLYHPDGRSVGLPPIPEYLEYQPRGLVSKQTSSDSPSPQLPITPADGLTSKPVERKLSFSTPPSSEHATHPHAQGHQSAQVSQADSTLYTEMPPPPVPHRSSVHLEPSLPSPVNAGGHTSERRPYFQRSSPLRNELTYRPTEQSTFDRPLKGISETPPPVPAWRPATAPAYPGMQQAKSIPDELPRIPKRELPFALSQKMKKTRTTSNQDQTIESQGELARDVRALTDLDKQRPATSPADAQTTRKGRSSQQPKKSAAKKKTGAKATLKKHDDSILSFIDEDDHQVPSQTSSFPEKRQITGGVAGVRPEPLAGYRKIEAKVAQLPVDSPIRKAPEVGVVAKQTELNPESTEALNACVACRKKRSKCDKALPACDKCKQEGQECDYTPPKKRSKPSQTAAISTPVIATNGNDRIATPVPTQSIGTQTALVSFSLPTRRDQGVQAEHEPDLKAKEIATVAGLMRAVDSMIHGQQQTDEDNANEGTQPNKIEWYGASSEATRGDRERAMERKICELLGDDRFIDFCEEVEQVCKRTGITI